MLSGDGRKLAESEKENLMERKELSDNRKELSITLLTLYAVITFPFVSQIPAARLRVGSL